jgi:hypothetical protein
MPEPDLYEARTTFISFHEGNGRPVRVDHRAVARAGHPIIDANPGMFVPLQVDYEVEKTSSTTKRYGGRKGSSGG